MPTHDTSSPVGAIVHGFDDAWDHAWESVQSSLKGVTTEEATWQHACYHDVEREEGWPLPGSVSWHVAHLTHCKRHYADVVRARHTSSMPEPRPWKAMPDFDATQTALREAHEDLRAAIAEVSDDDLEIALPRDMTVASFLHMVTRHDVWHAAQIAVARRLARMRRESHDL